MRNGEQVSQALTKARWLYVQGFLPVMREILEKSASCKSDSRYMAHVLPMTDDEVFLWGRSISVSMPRLDLEAAGRWVR